MKKLVSVVLSLIVCATLVAVAGANGGSVTMTIVSDTSVDVYGPLTSYAPVGDSAWTGPNPAVAAWVHSSWPSIAGATWISSAYYTEPPWTASTWRWFTKSVDLCPGEYASNIAGTIKATSDNAEDVYVNGTHVGSDGEVQDPWHDDHEWATIKDYDFTVDDGTETLTFDFIVRNYPGQNSATANPTGLIFKATITYDCGPLPVDIDIKPGSYPNCFNVNGHGVIPVAILGSGDFDVSQVDTSTLVFAGLAVRVKGKNGPQCSIEDVTGASMPLGAPDGYLDLVCQFVDDDSLWDPGDATATLTGNLLPEFGGTPFEGTDEICIRPPKPILVVSSLLSFSPTGWGGWSCPPDHPNVIDGGVSKTNTQPFVPADWPVVQGPAKPGSTVGGYTYPVFPHYTYTPPEQGWVVQNGGTAQNLYIYVYCGE